MGPEAHTSLGPDAASWVLLGTACLLAVVCGFNAWRAVEAWLRMRRHKDAVVSGGVQVGKHSLNDFVIGALQRCSRDMALPGAKRIAPKGLGAGRGFAKAARLAGLEGRVTPEGFAETRVRFALAGAALGVVFGLLFSMQMASVFTVAFGVIGFQLPGHVLRSRVRQRANDAERHLPEMLDVVALGMRSGLSFDSSLRIYASHFDTLLSRELENARIQWSSGLAQREEALRALAATYDSAVFGRVVDTIAKSIRYGSSMAASLESDAAEARSAYQSDREERIAKAPVKMMVPTGVLILPAMLIMVLGPVLLELMQGGF